ncbi:MAG: endolytic transglycosylase MltG [Bacilli bacterium]|nr:endolytic transglycosylase MltG [Bacilli bacterium]
MKRLKNIALFLVIFSTILVIIGTLIFKYEIGPISNKQDVVEVIIPKGSSVKQIASILKDKKLIRNETFFMLYIKLTNTSNMKAGIYSLSEDMGVEKIIEQLNDGTDKYEGEISITFKEGLNMREIAKVISEKTNNKYQDVIDKANDSNYINSLKEDYWFITDSLNNDDLYYKLEGYLYPDTYNFIDKDVSVETIFNVMIKEMDNKISKYKDTINNNQLSIHEIFTLASIVEEEASRDVDRPNVSSVFINRLNRNMPLGSDVTTRYAVKLDDYSKVLTASEYATNSKYNTRLTDGSMNGKLPVGPICNVSISSLIAAIEPTESTYIYFIANIKTKETFFYDNYNDFLVKKNELSSINNGY